MDLFISSIYAKSSEIKTISIYVYQKSSMLDKGLITDIVLPGRTTWKQNKK